MGGSLRCAGAPDENKKDDLRVIKSVPRLLHRGGPAATPAFPEDRPCWGCSALSLIGQGR